MTPSLRSVLGKCSGVEGVFLVLSLIGFPGFWESLSGSSDIFISSGKTVGTKSVKQVL